MIKYIPLNFINIFKLIDKQIIFNDIINIYRISSETHYLYKSINFIFLSYY